MSESASETKVGRERSRRGWVNTEQVGIGKQMTNEKMHNEVDEKSWRQKYSNKRQILFFHLTKDQYKRSDGLFVTLCVACNFDARVCILEHSIDSGIGYQ